jgi:hypothetical protein
MDTRHGGTRAFARMLAGPPAARQDCRAVVYFRTEVKTVHAAGSCGEGDAPAGTCQAAPAAPSSVGCSRASSAYEWGGRRAVMLCNFAQARTRRRPLKAVIAQPGDPPSARLCECPCHLESVEAAERASQVIVAQFQAAVDAIIQGRHNIGEVVKMLGDDIPPKPLMTKRKFEQLREAFARLVPPNWGISSTIHPWRAFRRRQVTVNAIPDTITHFVILIIAKV